MIDKIRNRGTLTRIKEHKDMLIAFGFVAVVAIGVALYKHVTITQIKTELQKLEAASVTDAKAVIAAIKAKL